jgi:hypothetical protein
VKKLRTRLFFDLVLGALLIFEMLYSLTGNFLHEVVGFVFFFTIALHLVLTRKWTKSAVISVRKGRSMAFAQKARMVLAVLLAVCGVALAVSSIAISNIIAGASLDVTTPLYEVMYMVHVVSSYSLCVLTIVHLAIHWSVMAKAFKIPYNPARRRAINTSAACVATVAAAAVGVTGLKVIGDNLSLAQAAGLAEGMGEGSAEGFGGVGEGRGNSGEGYGQGGRDNTYGEDNAYGQGDAYGQDGQGSRGDRGGQGGRGNSSDSYDNGDSNGYGYGNGNNESNGSNDSRGYNGENGSGNSNGNGGGNSNGYGNGNNGGNSNGYGNGNNGDNSSDSDNSDSGICTLCRKLCPLSNPRCDKPYRAGLI